MNRTILRIGPCELPITTALLCGAPSAAFDTERRIYLCAHHAQQAEQAAPHTEEEAAIAEAYAILRSNDGHMRELRGQE